MIKKLPSILIVLVIVITVCLTATGCSKADAKKIYATDLSDGAVVSASDNQEDADKLTDDSDSCWTTKNQGSYVEIAFGQKTAFNTVTIEEKTDNVRKFEIYYSVDGGEYEFLYRQDRIDAYRLCATEDVVADKIKIVFCEFDEKVSVKNIGVYYLKDKKGEFRVNAYLNSYATEGGSTQIQDSFGKPEYDGYYSVLTDVTLIGVAGMKTDGTIEYYAGEDNFHKDVELLKTLNPDIKVHVTIMLSLVPGDFKGTNNAVKKLVKEKLDVVQKSLREFVEKHNVDGIDYDWEYPQLPSEWAAYDKLLIATKEAINGRELSVALWPYGINMSKEARSVIDTVNMMTYDQFDERGDNSPIYEMGAKAIEYFLDKGFTKNQLRLGIPFYGRTADKYAIWTRFDETFGKWDNVKYDFEYVNADNEKVKSTLYANGYAMVRDKTALALANDLGGIMIFSTNSDDDATAQYSLHKAVAEVIEQRTE